MTQNRIARMQKVFRASVAGLVSVGMAGAMIVFTPAVHASHTLGVGASDRTSKLGELIVLDGLFAPYTGVSGMQNRVSRLGELIVLTNLFADRRAVAPTPQPTPTPTPTTTPPVTDVDAPIISDVKVENTATSSANVVWNTDEEATSKIFWSTTFPVVLSTASTTENTALKTEHRIELTDLTPDTTHFFIIQSADEAGNITRTIQLSFTTAEE